LRREALRLERRSDFEVISHATAGIDRVAGLRVHLMPDERVVALSTL
jgi:hypothetical protein